ncbi:MAG TPA: class I SAM-dependent methyltransferase [Symbiobacteriaceae bacterium]|nr:class I SAM-dependent methyltransferase [Symbiobacteriaceae bacterium]
MPDRFDPTQMDRLIDPARRAWNDPALILSHLDLPTKQTFADIGCGPGYFTLEAARLMGPTAMIWGVDVSEEMLERLGQRAAQAGLATVKPTLAEEEDEFPLHSGTVEAALLANAYHETDPASNFLFELKRTLAPGAPVLVVEWKPEPTPAGPPQSERLQMADVQEEFELAGFTCLGERPVGPYHWGLLFTRS